MGVIAGNVEVSLAIASNAHRPAPQIVAHQAGTKAGEKIGHPRFGAVGLAKYSDYLKAGHLGQQTTETPTAHGHKSRIAVAGRQ